MAADHSDKKQDLPEQSSDEKSIKDEQDKVNSKNYWV